ncbi:sushi domain-containing protein 2-like [Bradysia coprophila]|uniref:sushi domain-containing protein 2-like n=1 Tax=Bradysia coprophila TaxID=38358 RepID=UPI00187DC356|nr:sushi domain-containing protein 2-like [Bradysia coprophila]
MKVAIVCISLVVFAYSTDGIELFGRNKCVGKHAEFEQLTITPSFVSIFGNIPITIQGPSLQDAVSVQIRFNDKTEQIVDGSITGGNVVTCILPFLYKNGRIRVDMIVKLTDNTIQTFYGFIYTQKHRSDLEFELVGTTVKVSWEKTHFDVDALLDLELWEVVSGILTSRGVIMPNIPNIGFFTGEVNSLVVTLIQNLINIYIVELKININSGSSQNSTKPQHPLITNWLNQLKGKSERELNQLCYSWYIQDKGAPSDAECCPRTLKEARVDERFEPVDDLKLYNPEADYGFMQKVPSLSGAAQRCVYKNGTLLVGPPSGGNVRSVSPNGENGEMAHIIADILPWYTCCKLSVTKSYCNLYYEKRPSNDGKCYRPPHCGHVIGDPHFTTFDGLYYTFLGLGEFWVIRSEDFAMQGRFTQFKDTKATVCTVYVMYQRSFDGEATVQLSLKEKYIEIMIDGQVVAMDPNVKQPQRTIMYNGVSIVITSPEDITITFSTGYSFKFTYDPFVINMAGLVAEELKGSFRGLFGVFDDNQENELTYPNGRVIPTNSDSRAIHDFGMSWKLTCEESHFTYPLGKGYDNFYDDNFVPLFEVPDLDKLSPEDVEACKGSYECLFDLSVTGNREMALGTQKAVENFSAIAKATSVGCERISVPRNGYLVVINYSEGSTVRLVCNTNFQVQGIDSVKCVRDLVGMLSWDGKLGMCVKINKCANENAWLQWLCENGLSA